MSGHTKGPWNLEKFGGAFRGGAVCAGEKQVALATAPPSLTPEEQAANARLIASAPDLLAAAEAVMARLGTPARGGLRGIDFEDLEVIGTLRAAIAKARGG